MYTYSFTFQKCPDGEFLVTDFKNKQWFCNKNGQIPTDPPHLDNVVESAFDLSDFGIDTYEGDDDRILTRCPVGGYNICPTLESTPAPTLDPNSVTENPLGTCRCNGELWVSEGCSYGFYCNDTLEIGGELKNCPTVCIHAIIQNLISSWSSGSYFAIIKLKFVC